VNCGETVDPNDAQMFSQVFVCSSCHLLATRMLQRAERSLDLLKSLAKMSIRQALLTRKLQFHARALNEPVDIDFIGELSRMVQQVKFGVELEARECSTSEMQSKVDTKPRVSVVGGPPSSTSQEE